MRSYEPLIVIVVVVGLPIAWFLFTLVVGIFEVFYVWPYEPTEGSLPYHARLTAADGPVNPYAVRSLSAEDELLNAYSIQASEHAHAAGFQHLGVLKDARCGIYRLRYDGFVSPQRDVFVLIGCGSIAKIPLNATWMFTMLSDGNCLVTIDNQSGTHHDLTGLTEERILPLGTFEQLLERQRTRIANKSVPVVPYSSIDPWNDLKAFRIRRAELLVDRNYARFIDPARTKWRYSLWGAVLVTINLYWRQLRPQKD